MITGGETALSVLPGRVELHTTFPGGNTPVAYSFMVGRKRLRVLCMSKSLADRTWFTNASGQNYIICGPAYVSAVAIQNKQVIVHTEHPWQQNDDYPVWIYGNGIAGPMLKHKSAPALVAPFSLQSWQMKNASVEAAPAYNDRNWKTSDKPLPMGADGDTTAYAWYRSTIDVPAEGNYTLQVEGGDRQTAFADGIKAGLDTTREGEIVLHLSRGKHTLAVFTAHDGRDKLAGYMGPIDSVDNKGIFGDATIMKGGPFTGTLRNWQFLKALSRDDVNKGIPPPGNEGWKGYSIGQDAFGTKQGFGWFRTTIPKPPAGITQIILNFRSVDENATVFINGKEIVYHDGWNRPFFVTLDKADTIEHPLVLTLFIENYSNEGGIDRPVRLHYTGNASPVKGWRMRGGPGDWQQATGWKALDDTMQSGSPCFFRNYFTAPAPVANGPHMIWRVLTNGLGHGFVWVNGHNLGRYPEKVPVNGLYIPECWIKTGKNTLLVYDEEGKRPGGVSIQPETAACREIEIWSVPINSFAK